MRIRFNNKGEFHEFLFTYLYHGLQGELFEEGSDNLDDLINALNSKGLNSILKKFFVSTSSSSRVQTTRFIKELQMGNDIGLDIKPPKSKTHLRYLD